jgi:hypothetical protein
MLSAVAGETQTKIVNFKTFLKLLTMPKALFFSLFLFLFSFNVRAQQTWQWGKKGGSGSLSSNNVFETVLDVACDKWGNTYVTGRAYQAGMQIDGQFHNGFGDADILLASFACDGSYRWSKVLGAEVGDNACGLAVDTMGGVYLSFSLFITTSLQYTGHIGNDTILTNTNKTLLLVKFDTAGDYQWLRMPQPDSTTTSTISNTRILDLDVSKEGDIYWVCKLIPANYANGAYLPTVNGIHVLHYNAQGIFQGGFPLEMDATGMAMIDFNFKRDHQSGRLYATGTAGIGGTVSFGGVPFANSMYVAAFDAQGQLIWLRQDNIDINSLKGKPAIDDSGNIYVAGYAFTGYNFNGYTFNSPYNVGPVIISLDSSGANRWVKYGSSDNSSTSCIGVALRNNNELVATGYYPGLLQWPGYTGQPLQHLPNQGHDIFITRLNAATGAVIDMDSIASPFGEDEYPTAICNDGNGNIIVGGQFAGTLYAGTADTLYNSGGETDFFITKYGYPCGCTVPAADLYYTLSGWNGSFTYTGTGQHDSLRWYFGDGSSSAQTNPNHSYTANGSYTVCVTAYNSCDSNQHCETIQVSVGVNTLAGIDNITVYPNPAKELLQLKGLMEATQYRLLSVTGTVMQQGRLELNNNGISTKDLAPGMYLLELSNTKQQGVVRVMKL